jgi:hypothetical protein
MTKLIIEIDLPEEGVETTDLAVNALTRVTVALAREDSPLLDGDVGRLTDWNAQPVGTWRVES